MNNYVVDIKNNKIACTYDGKKLNREEIFNLLYHVDMAKNNKIFVQGNKIIIRNTKLEFSLTLNNPIEFVKSDFKNNLRNNLDTINENIKQIQMKKHIGKAVKTISVGLATTVAPLVLVSMLHSSVSEDKTLDNNFMEPIRNEQSMDFHDIMNKILEPKNKLNEFIEENNIKIGMPDPGENVTQSGIKDDLVYRKDTEIIQDDLIQRGPKITVDVPVANNSKNPEIEEIHKKFESECEKAGNRWGWSKELLLGFLTQESHGKETNLMQITYKAFEDEVMNVFNYEENKWVKVVITNHPEDFKDVDIRITEKELENPYTNIATAAILLNYSTTKLNTDNVFAIIEYYNKGYGNFQKNMYAMEANTDKKTRQVLDDPTDIEFVDYSFACNQGDPNYVYNVLQYVPNAEFGGIKFKRIVDNQIREITVNVNRTLNMEYAKGK